MNHATSTTATHVAARLSTRTAPYTASYWWQPPVIDEPLCVMLARINDLLSGIHVVPLPVAFFDHERVERYPVAA